MWFWCTYAVKPSTSASDDFHRWCSSTYFPRLVSARRAGVWHRMEPGVPVERGCPQSQPSCVWAVLEVNLHGPSAQAEHAACVVSRKMTFVAKLASKRRTVLFSFILRSISNVPGLLEAQSLRRSRSKRYQMILDANTEGCSDVSAPELVKD